MERTLQKQEALARMRTLKLHENVIREFEKDDIINQSEHGGILFWLDDNQKALVERFEKEYNAVVYHVIHSYTEFGELLAYLYVSQHEDEWGYDRDDLRQGTPIAYVENLDDSSLSEFGGIGIKSQFGGLCRTA